MLQLIRKEGEGVMKSLKIFFLATLPMLLWASLAHAATGQELYQNQCATCHGVTGAGDGPQAGQNGVAAPQPFTTAVPDRMTIEKAMREGVNNIPGHGNASLFVGDELQNLIDYVYQLAQPQPKQ
jgi:cytochrome c5